MRKEILIFGLVSQTAMAFSSLQFVLLTLYGPQKNSSFGVAETHMDTTKLHVKKAFWKQLLLITVNGIFIAPSPRATSTLGRTANVEESYNHALSVYNVANLVMESASNKYGRYVSQTVAGHNGKKATVISAYRVVEGHAGPASAYSQQGAMLVTKGSPANPRGMFLLDMAENVLAAENKRHSIILGLDVNESWERKTSGIRTLAEKCGLVNIHAELSSQQKWESHKKQREFTN